jgi:hypothetical protein
MSGIVIICWLAIGFALNEVLNFLRAIFASMQNKFWPAGCLSLESSFAANFAQLFVQAFFGHSPLGLGPRLNAVSIFLKPLSYILPLLLALSILFLGNVYTAISLLVIYFLFQNQSAKIVYPLAVLAIAWTYGIQLTAGFSVQFANSSVYWSLFDRSPLILFLFYSASFLISLRAGAFFVMGLGVMLSLSGQISSLGFLILFSGAITGDFFRSYVGVYTKYLITRIVLGPLLALGADLLLSKILPNPVDGGLTRCMLSIGLLIGLDLFVNSTLLHFTWKYFFQSPIASEIKST